MIIKNFEKFVINENLNNFDLSKIVSVVSINQDSDGKWVYTTNENKKFILPKDKAGKITLINEETINYVNSGHPISKYFETEDDGETLSYVANFAADAVPFREGRVYIIERKDGRGWALPGGFMDPGETPKQSAIRELQEETLAKKEDIIKVEPIGMFRANDPRDIYVYTYSFIVYMTNSAELKFGDDAKNGKWLLLKRAIKMPLAFTHHNEILKNIYY